MRASTRSVRVSRKRRGRPWAAGPGLGGGEEGSAAAAAAVLGGDVEAGELAGRVDAEVAGGDAVGAQDEEDAEAVGRELLEREVDLGLVGLRGGSSGR